MTPEQLDSRLRNDSHVMGTLGNDLILLMRNALYPWFVIVPQTDAVEFYQLPVAQQHQLMDLINRLAHFVETHFPTTKINIGMIGNIVRQMHLHVVGRHEHDACWPKVVWGSETSAAYSADQIRTIQQQLRDALGSEFVIA